MGQRDRKSVMTAANLAVDIIPELSCYGLPGHADDPRALLTQLADAERIGIGSMFLSERFNVKEIGALTGAAAAASSKIGIATGVTNVNSRHPLVTASYAMTAHKLSIGRFALGIGRGIPAAARAYGIPVASMSMMEDYFSIWRRLWKGEMIVGHDGPAGRYPVLRMGVESGEPIPIMVSALGLKTMEWAGRVSDGVILHTFFSDEALRSCVAAIHRGAEQAGRDPKSVKVWSVLATLATDGSALTEDRRLKALVGRMATYLQVYGDPIVSINGWDPAVLDRFRADDVVRSVPGAIDAVATREQLLHIETLIPQHWYPAAVGGPDACVERVLDQFACGADGVILHGAEAATLEPVVNAYRSVRDPAPFAHRHANPGR
jgi:5,10-methylenetetrahydromethanopterin reductase